MKKIVGVRFRKPGKVYFFDPDKLNIEKGQKVIVETSQGQEIGDVTTGVREIEESSLTGETEAILKDSDMICKKDIPLGDMLNMAFMSSIVVNGHAKAVVTETGMNTRVGKIALSKILC